MSDTIKLTRPTVHLNGTSRAALMQGYLTAIDAVRAAEDAHQATYPNGRDYYPQGDGAIKAAMAEHRARAEKLRAVLDELNALAEGLM